MKDPIIIIGAGPTGLTLALTLHRNKVPFRIIDQESTPQQQSRALALHARSMEVFEDLGIVEELLAPALKVRYVDIYLKKKKRTRFDMGMLVAPYPFITVLPQKKTEHILMHKLHQGGVRVERGSELISVKQIESHVEVVIQDESGNEERGKASWVIGCDGPHSVIRGSIGSTFKGYQYQTSYTLADVQMESTLGYGALNAFGDARGSIFIFPLGTDYYRIVCQKLKGRDKEHTTLEALETMVKERALGNNKILDVEWISDFKISHRQADIYRKNRLIIAGDAAHIHSPVGGQGLNTGVQDAYNLGWKLAYVYRHNAKEKLMASYSRERIPIGKKVLRTSQKLTKMITCEKPSKVTYYSNVLQMIDRMSRLKAMIAYQLSGISLRYKKSPIIKSQMRLMFFLPAVSAGCRLFDGVFLQSKSKLQKRVFHITQGPMHHLFIFFKEHKLEMVKKVKASLERKYPDVLKVHLITSCSSIEDEECWFDRKRVNARPYRLWSPFMVLTRPDGYIGMTKRGIKEKSVIGYFEKLLGVYQ